MPTSFVLETMVNFPDDTSLSPITITPAHVDSLMAALKRAGIRRVVWSGYGDGHGGWFVPAGIERLTEQGILDAQHYWGTDLRSRFALGGNPLRVAVAAAHRHGIEVYGYCKPYETGASMVFAEGSPEALEWGRLYQIGGYNAWLDPFVLNNPHLRLQRRADDLWPGHETATVHTLKLTKNNAAPTRVRKENIQIWTSPLNYGYQRKPVSFTFTDTIEPSGHDVRDTFGTLVTKAGDPVRVLTLSGLNLTDKYIAVTTNLSSATCDFENTWDRLLSAYDERGREIPGVFAAGGAIWFPQLERFPQLGLVFDTGWGTELTGLETPRTGEDYADASSHMKHAEPGQKNVRGVIAFARGRNPYASGALCETEPAVQEFWLTNIREMLDAGVNGVEFRVENHSCHTVTPEDYGFNPAVMARINRKPASHAEQLAEITRVRSAAYTEFLRRAKNLIASRGKRMRVTLNVNWFRPPAERPGWRKIAYPANIDFHWKQWVEEGLMDEAILRIFAMPFQGLFGGDPVAQDMISTCQRRGMPVTVNRYVVDNPEIRKEFDQVRHDGRFAGFNFYQTWSFASVTPEAWEFATPERDTTRSGPQWQTRWEMARLVQAACKAAGTA